MVMRKIVWSVLLLTGVAAAASVKVETGLVEGTSEDGLTVYRGIPFAAPPVGDLRWRAPQPVVKMGWSEAGRQVRPGLHAGRESRSCHERGLPLSECLDAREVGQSAVPVMVWICGGGFAGGATSFPTYSGEKLAKRGVVLVSIAYRVGTLVLLC
jgi:para-nitrobenzyl esterase